tara:strand:+ start:2133 stop:2390 length:258 start_codon:yes stop_codon:yes gene_type:complete
MAHRRCMHSKRVANQSMKRARRLHPNLTAHRARALLALFPLEAAEPYEVPFLKLPCDFDADMALWAWLVTLAVLGATMWSAHYCE